MKARAGQTPASVHYGAAPEVLAGRDRVLAEAYSRHPERFVNGQPKAGHLPEAVWINKPATLVVATAS